jgi:hypothetical protein
MRFLAGDPQVDALVRELAMIALWHQALVANLAEMRGRLRNHDELH